MLFLAHKILKTNGKGKIFLTEREKLFYSAMSNIFIYAYKWFEYSNVKHIHLPLQIVLFSNVKHIHLALDQNSWGERPLTAEWLFYLPRRP